MIHDLGFLYGILSPDDGAGVIRAASARVTRLVLMHLIAVLTAY